MTLVGEKAVPSLELLERAAESVGMTTSWKGRRLKVCVLGRTALYFSQENGKVTRNLRFGWLPGWWKLLFVLVLAVMTVKSFASAPHFDKSVVVQGLLFLGFALATATSSSSVEHATERLYDRAYDIAKSLGLARLETVPSCDQLQRAASSLGMMTERNGASLKVVLARFNALHLSEETGHATQVLRSGTVMGFSTATLSFLMVFILFNGFVWDRWLLLELSW